MAQRSTPRRECRFDGPARPGQAAEPGLAAGVGGCGPRRRAWLAACASALALPAGSAWAQVVDAFASAALSGAGSTFVHPLMDAWAREYRASRKGGASSRLGGGGLEDEIGGVALDYEAVGSRAGIQRVKARAVDFAVSEMPLPADDLARERLLQVPLASGAIAVAANLGPQADAKERVLQLSPGLLAEIFLGRVTRWDDASLAAENPGLALPAQPILVQHRVDGSGTTWTFTRWLSGHSADWSARVGHDLAVAWPTGQGVEGTGGMARAIGATPGAIGYLDAVQAQRAGLVRAALRNPAGRYVAPRAAALRAAVDSARFDDPAAAVRGLLDQPGESAYPLVAVVYGLARAEAGARQQAALAFLDWVLAHGATSAEALGYAALPAAAAQALRQTLR